MKTQNTATITKLMNRFDNELKNILMNDLSAARNRALVNAINNNFNSRLKAA